MAKGKTMLQVDAVFGVAPNVLSEMPSAVFASLWLDGGPTNKTRVREISAQQAYFTGLSGPAGSGVSAIESGAAAFAMLTLIVGASPDSKRNGTIKALKEGGLIFGSKYHFNSPSFRNSPDIHGADLAFLEVRMPSWSVTSPWKIQSAKRIGGHAYIDELFVPPPPVEMAPPPKTVLETKAPIVKVSKSKGGKKSKKSMDGLHLEFWAGRGVGGAG